MTVTFAVILVARRGLHADHKYSRHVFIEFFLGGGGEFEGSGSVCWMKVVRAIPIHLYTRMATIYSCSICDVIRKQGKSMLL